MPKIALELSALAVKNISTPGFHSVGGVPGLHLQITDTGARSWILRIRVGNKRRDIGLGSYPGVTLAQARQKARETREQVRKGIDPVLERQAAKARLIAVQSASKSFDDAVQEFMKSKSQELAPKQAAFWQYTFDAYASPVIGKIDVSLIELPHIVQILEPIWARKTETARRLRGRIEAVLDWAIAREYRKGANPARWKGNLKAVLPKPGRIAKTTHLRALPYAAMPDFMRQLAEVEGAGARALRFAILTAARSGEVRGATWQEIDFRSKTWTVPAERMKAGQLHHVPLSDAAIAALKALPVGEPGDYIFLAPRRGMLSDMTISAVTRRMGVDAVPHGFRSTFRDWAAEATDYPREAAEMALAHVVRGVEGAYRRGDMYDKRVSLMADWARYILQEPSTVAAVPQALEEGANV